MKHQSSSFLARQRSLLVAIMVIAVSFSNLSLTAGGADGYSVQAALTGLTPHSPIYINGDDEFAAMAAAEGWSGNGSISNPYIIERYEINDGYNGSAIYIGNTECYFVIRNCSLYNSYREVPPPFHAGAGIQLNRADNGFVRDNVIQDNIYGIYLRSSDGARVINNTLINNSDCAIWLRNSYYDILENNTMINCSIKVGENAVGFYVTHEISPSNTVNGKPVYFYKSVDMAGASVPTDAGQVILAQVTNLNVQGLHIDRANTAIIAAFSNHITIANNTFTNCTYYAVYLDQSTSVTIYRNIFEYNHKSSTTYNAANIQAYDDGNNTWNLSNGGNYWLDWTTPDSNHDGFVDNPYVISGGLASDKLPLTQLDVDSPLVNITHPSDGETIHTVSPVATWTAYDARSGLDYIEVSLDGAPFASVGLVDSILLYNIGEGSHTFSVRAFDKAQNSATDTVSFTCLLLHPSSAPQDLQATRGDEIVELIWEAPADLGNLPILEYNVLRNGSYYATVGGLTYNDYNVSNGVEYFYTVVANNSAGQSAESNEVSAIPAGVPHAPAISGEVHDQMIKIVWSAPYDNGDAILCYDVFRNGNYLDTTTSTWYEDSGLTNGVTYTYEVAANNSVGQGVKSNVVSIIPAGVPFNPVLSGVRGNEFVNLSWTVPNSNGNSIDHYVIYRNGSSYVTVYGTWFNDTAVANGFQYTYRVAAVNSIGEGVQSNQVSLVPATLPSAPQGLSAEVGDESVIVSWSAPSSNGGSSIIAYSVYRDGVWIGNTTNLWFEDTGLINGNSYDYYVTAWNVIGESAASVSISAIPMAAPDAPSNLASEYGDSFVNISWSAPYDGGSSITLYRVYVGDASGSYGWSEVVSTTYLNLTNLTNGHNYFFAVSAENSVGEGPLSDEVSATPMTIPSAPSTIQATRGDGQVNLTWSAPISDGGSQVLGYEIFRNGTWYASSENIWFLDDQLANGVEYFYSVAARNSEGVGPMSVQVSSIPAGLPGIPSVMAKASNEHVNLTWSAVNSNGASIQLYSIYRNGTLYGTTVNTWFDDSSVINGVIYSYKVSATNAVGEGQTSAPMSVTPMTVPEAPELEVQSGSGFAQLSWSAPFDGGSDITEWKIYRGNSSDNLTLLATVNALAYNDTAVLNGATYYYVVSAVNSVGEGARSSVQQATPHASEASDKGGSGFGGPWILFLILAGLIVAICMMLLFLSRRKKKKEQKK